MTPTLHLAANLVPETVFYGHLQMVFEDAAGNLFENETTSPGFPYFFGDWEYPAFGRSHDDTSNTPGYGNPNDYAIVSLSLRPEQTAEYVWELMGQIHASLSTGRHGLDYDIGQNSNSYATSVLWVVGIDIASYLSAVTPPDVSGFPGLGTNIFHGAKTGGLLSGYDTPIPLTLAGTAGDDYIRTGIGDDTLGGAAGDDEIRAGGGNDFADGGGGADAVHGGAGHDILRGVGAEDGLWGGPGDDTLNSGTGNDTIRGGIGNDVLAGGGGDDRLFGGDGDDLIAGGAGIDTLFGNSGADIFLFRQADDSPTGSAADRIMDFELGIDRIKLSDFGLDDTEVSFGGGFIGGVASARVFTAGADTRVLIDDDGDGVADFHLTVVGVTGLDLGDFIL